VTDVPTPRPRYPDAIRLDVNDELHKQQVPDPYRWLENTSDPRTARWTEAQDALFAVERETWVGQEYWHNQLSSLTRVTVATPPVIRGGRTFFTWREAGAPHPALTVAEMGTDRQLIDPASLDPAGRTVLDAWHPSLEGDLLAFQMSANGTEESRLSVLDVTSLRIVDGPIDRVRSTAVGWLPGGEMFYYVRRLPPGVHPGQERYHRRVYLHRIGTDPDDDVLIFGEGRGHTQFYSLSVTEDGRWLTISATTGTDPRTELWIADLASSPPDQPLLQPVHQGEPTYTRLRIAPGTGPDDSLCLLTHRGAPRGRVVTATAASPGEDAWRELVPQRPDAVLDQLAMLGGPATEGQVAVAGWIRHATAHLTVHDVQTGHETGEIPLPGSGTVMDLRVQPAGGDQLWIRYTDHVTPPTVLHHDLRTGATTPWRSTGPSFGTGVVAKLHMVRSHDGTEIPVFVIAAGGQPDRPRPAILTGYGGFGTSMSPRYQPTALAWVRAGGVYAVACLRGGGEDGGEWHRAGSGASKQNTFDDFDSVTDYLVDNGWTSPDQLGIIGASNGGLLMGAALTQHPEKYAATVCISGLLDMARYEMSGLGPSWVPEYGSAADPEGLRTLLSYSPYHHVTPGTAYPAALIVAFDNDTRVDPLHSRKMCAALQYASAGAGPVVMWLGRGAGHGTTPLSLELEESAAYLAFFAAHLGLKPPGDAE
jgi:prolyl oligopeptidase